MNARLTQTQANLLNTFTKLPARYRLHGRAYNPIKLQVLDSYDARSWSGLFQKGLLEFKNIGGTPYFVVVGQSRGR